MASSKRNNDSTSREHYYYYEDDPKNTSTTSTSRGRTPAATNSNYLYPQRAVNNNIFQRSYHYVNNSQKYHEHQNHLHLRKYDKIQVATPEFGVRSCVDDFQFTNERRYADQPTADGYFRPSFRSDREVRDPIFYSYQNFDRPIDQLLNLASPDLDHVGRTNPPATSMVVPNRAMYRGRFNVAKSDMNSASPPSLRKDLGENDIVCGRGAPTLFHEGNKKFRELILQYQSIYLLSKRPDKPRVAWKVLEIISSKGGRFVRRVKGNHQSPYAMDRGGTKKSSCYQWEPLNERQSYEKICQSLREGSPELRRRILRRTKADGRQEQESNEKIKRDGLQERQAEKVGSIQSQKEDREVGGLVHKTLRSTSTIRTGRNLV